MPANRSHPMSATKPSATASSRAILVRVRQALNHPDRWTQNATAFTPEPRSAVRLQRRPGKAVCR